MGTLPEQSEKQPYSPKPYEQMTYPGQRVQIDVKVVPRSCCPAGQRFFQYTAIDEFSRLRYLAAYEEQSPYSSANFLKKAYAFFKRHGFTVECVQTDNGFEFTNRFAQSKRELVTLFEKTAAELSIQHKLIRPYTPRHNGKVERSHREDQRRFYDSHLQGLLLHCKGCCGSVIFSLRLNYHFLMRTIGRMKSDKCIYSF